MICINKNNTYQDKEGVGGRLIKTKHLPLKVNMRKRRDKGGRGIGIEI
jgi:hypothetical protein